MSVPVHVWQPPKLASTVGKKVVLSAVVGPKEVADPIKEKLLATTPRDTGRATTVIDAAVLQDKTKLQLVSAIDQEPNDVALASVARRHGADYLLRGEVIPNLHPSNLEASSRLASNHQDADHPGSDHQDTDRTDADRPAAGTIIQPSLKLSWRLTSLGEGGSNAGMPVVVDVDSAVDRYPDLSLLSDPQQVLAGAAVRDTYRLITPSVERDEVQLAIAYWLPGSREVRRGNVAALAGRWGEAEAIWSNVWKHHPTQVAAIHNLALAAAAGQDFSRAKQLARKAIRLQPSALHKKTLVWIELMQRDYHASFGLPDPPEGWFVTN